jgi:hypothetical protein
MLRITCFVVALFAGTILHAQFTDAGDSTPVNVYHHYTGTVGTHKAVMDIRYGFPGVGNYAGSSYYLSDEPGLNFFLIRGPQAYSKLHSMSAQVYPERIRLDQASDVYSILMPTVRFDFAFSHDSLNGSMYVPSTQEQLKIRLKEDRNDPSLFIFKSDSATATATGKKGESLKATATYYGSQPAAKMKKKDVAFICKSVAHFMGGTEHGEDLAHICNESYISRFKAAVASGEKLDASSFTSVCMLFPIYSDDGFLVLQQSGYRYDFDQRAYTDASRYLCLDMRQGKELRFDDVISASTETLSATLERALRTKFHLEPGNKLSELFIDGKSNMPVSHNIALVNKGIIFSYSPALLFKEDLDIAGLQEMRIFLSYDDLAAMLKPEFKVRLGLK